ncbi:hypothetical protein [Gordonia sp. NPDC003585]|uniref:hypothetical protein n=1 Tax=Gordonia sp. NPDC003585 TaxID=3154275 RepID=UPI0033A56DE8
MTSHIAGDAGVSAPPASPTPEIDEERSIVGLLLAIAFTVWALLVAVGLLGSIWLAVTVVGVFVSLAMGAFVALSRM